jgi:hypothetical protein
LVFGSYSDLNVHLRLLKLSLVMIEQHLTA